MKNKPPNWYVDNVWTCGCGSLNAAYLKKCGGCKKKKKKQMSTERASGPQLNQLRDNYNDLVSKKRMAGSTKRVVWQSKRRFGNI